MDYEKKYKEALERARQFSEKPYLEDSAGIVEYIFPELKESEDERIKKMLRDVISQWRTGNQAWCSDVKLIDATLAWLEKQGEQKPNPCDGCINRKGCINCENGELRETEHKPADNVEPKFKQGNWVVNKRHSYLIAYIDYEQRRYLFEIGGYTHEQLNWEYIENADKKYHLWTIQDAKKGDILQADKCILIFDSLTKDIDGNTVVSSWYHCDTKTFYGMGTSEPDLWVSTNIVPATKEQRDLLFQKMKEAGYEWNADKKELKKIEQKPMTGSKFKVGDKVVHKETGKLWTVHWYIKEDNAYSVEDSEGLINIYSPNVLELIEQKPAWSEEDENFIYDTLSNLTELKDRYGAGYGNVGKCIGWLRTLKDRVQPQPKQEWSYNDEIIIETIIQEIEKIPSEKFIDNAKYRCLDWLRYRTKSLRPQSQWKPSESDILLLERIANGKSDPQDFQATLCCLIEQLKKLKG